MPLEERLYRLRCVEAWAMAVPWTGFPMKALPRPRKAASARRATCAWRPSSTNPSAPGQRQTWYPWPYTEGLTIEEAGERARLPGHRRLRQAAREPVRRAACVSRVPWKYGFKSAKSIVKFTFAEERPKSFWEALQPSEYGFWANVNPAVPHPRWSQADRAHPRHRARRARP